MFDWFWNFLYLLTKAMFQLIDGIMSICNKISGIDTISIDGDDTDLLTWLLKSDEVGLAFRGAAMIGLFLVVFFTIWAIIKAIVAEKPEQSPARIALGAGKTLLVFLFVPALMLIALEVVNTIGTAMYTATGGASTKGLGSFLAGAFGQDARYAGVPETFYLADDFDYMSTSKMWTLVDLSDYNYFFAWVASFAILFALTRAMMILIERVFSVIVLYVVAPFSISATIVDGGNHFKIWRDQVISKFLIGYAGIIAINLFTIIVAKLSTADIVFFQDKAFLNFLIKVAIILGGAFSIEKIMAMVGNLVQAGAGDMEMKNAGDLFAQQKGAAKMAGKLGLGAVGLTGKGLGKLGKFVATKAGWYTPKSNNESGEKGNGNSSNNSGSNEDGNKNPDLKTNNDNGSNMVVNSITGSSNNKNTNNGNKKPDNQNKNSVPNKTKGNDMIKNALTGNSLGGDKK